MRYFISVLADQNFKDYTRDLARFLSSYKRNLVFVPLDELHFNLKFLGSDLSKEEIENLAFLFKEKILSRRLVPFSHPVGKIDVHMAGLKKPESLRVKLKQTPDLNEFARLINDWTGESGVNNLVLRKDYNRLIGAIKLANFKGNISSHEFEILEQKLKEFVGPTTITITGLTIFSTETYRNKFYRKIHSRLNFNLE